MRSIWQRLARREKGLVLVAFAIFAVILARSLLVLPFLERRAWVKSQLEIQPQLLEKSFRYLNQQEQIMAGLEKARSELKFAETSLLSGDTPSVSASDLQQAVQNLASKGGTQVILTRVLTPEPLGSFIKIPIQMEVSGQIDQITDLIRGIDSSEKLLVINELNVRALFTAMPPQRQQMAQLSNQSIRASLIVSGFARSQAAQAQKGEAGPVRTKAKEGATSGRKVLRQP